MVILETTAAFRKHIEKLDPQLKERVKLVIASIAVNPEKGKPLRHELKGMRRVHIGAFRILYRYHNDTVTFLLFDKRESVYE